MQDEICSNNKILLPANSKIHDDIVNIIKQNHFNDYIIQKDVIISKMLCNKKNSTKAKKKKLMILKNKFWMP